MPAVLLPNAKVQFEDINGKPLVGGTVGMYVPGTLTAKTTWQDAAKTIANIDPIVLDARGQAIIWGSGTYRQILKDSAGNLIWDELTEGLNEDAFMLADGSNVDMDATQSLAFREAIDAQTTHALNLVDFGVKGDGSTDDAPGFNAALAALRAQGGGELVGAPAAIYSFHSQVTFNATGLSTNAKLSLSGGVIKTTGAISGLKIAGSSPPFSILVEGLSVNHVNNATATAGFEAAGTAYVSWRNCSVYANSAVPAGYAGFALRQADPSNSATCCLWSSFPGCVIKPSDSSLIPIGIFLEGQANATDVIGVSINGCASGVFSTPVSGGAYGLANGVAVMGSWFEGCTNGVRYLGSAGNGGPFGVEVIANRFENISGACLSLEGADVDNSQQAPVIAMNAVSNGTIILNNPHSLVVSNLALRLGLADILQNGNGFTLANSNSAFDTLTLGSSGNGSGFALKQGVNLIATLRPVGGNPLLTAASGFTLGLGGISGISASATVHAQNLAGSVTLSGTSATVTFATAEVDANYAIFLNPIGGSAGAVSVSGQSTGGFTVHGPSGATVYWLVVHL